MTKDDIRPRIQSDERGITINKPLAWTMLTALVMLVWYGGTTVSNLQSSIERLSSTQRGNMADIAAIEGRLRPLENGMGRMDARMEAVRQSVEELKSGQRETNNLLRDLAEQISRTP